MSAIMVDYTRYIIDPSEQPEQITCSKDFFDMDGFRLHKGAKKNYHFIYKLTETNHFSYFIESRCFGKSDRDNQIMQFDQLIHKKRTRMNPRLLFPFIEEKSISSMAPNDYGILPDHRFNYKVFPKFNYDIFIEARPIPNYNKDSL